jgi:hypothetical protein
MKLFTRKPSYSLEELDGQIGAIGQLMKQRGQSMQLAVVNQSDAKQQQYLEEVDNFTDAIEVATEVFKFMCEEVLGNNNESKASNE